MRQNQTACLDAPLSSLHVLDCGEAAVCTLADALFYNLNTDVTESIIHVIQATLRQLLIRFSLPWGQSCVKCRAVTLSLHSVTLTSDGEQGSSSKGPPTSTGTWAPVWTHMLNHDILISLRRTLLHSESQIRDYRIVSDFWQSISFTIRG